MYGVLRAAGCGLPPQERDTWWGHLCGLCTALREQFGQPARLATNSDAALVITLCEAQAEQPIPNRNSLCLLYRPLFRRIDDPTHPAVSFAAGAAMLSAVNKVRDNLQDDPAWLKGLRRPARWLAEHWRVIAEEYLAALGFSADLVESQFRMQVDVEAHPGGDFTTYSQPTELAVGAVFAHTAVLAGRAHNAEPLFELGRGYGRIMLLLDAGRDYNLDAGQCRFNPLAAAYPGQDWHQPAETLFHQAYRQLRQAVEALELPNPALLRSLLLSQLGQTGHRTLGLCHASAAADEMQPRGGTLAAAAFQPPNNLNPPPFDEPFGGDTPDPGQDRCCRGGEYTCCDCCIGPGCDSCIGCDCGDACGGCDCCCNN